MQITMQRTRPAWPAENYSSLPETGRSQAANPETQKQTKLIEMHQSQVNMRS